MNNTYLFDKSTSTKIYSLTYEWLANFSLGERRLPSSYSYYTKNLFDPLLKKYESLKNKENLSESEKEFIELTFYIGPIFRIQNYYSSYHQHIYLTNTYCHWSKDLDGITKLHSDPEQLLLVGETDGDRLGINIFGLLTYLFKFNRNFTIETFKNPESLTRYEYENEIAAPMSKETLRDIRIVEVSKILDWEKNSPQLDFKKWYRKNPW